MAQNEQFQNPSHDKRGARDGQGGQEARRSSARGDFRGRDSHKSGPSGRGASRGNGASCGNGGPAVNGDFVAMADPITIGSPVAMARPAALAAMLSWRPRSPLSSRCLRSIPLWWATSTAGAKSRCCVATRALTSSRRVFAKWRKTAASGARQRHFVLSRLRC